MIQKILELTAPYLVGELKVQLASGMRANFLDAGVGRAPVASRNGEVAGIVAR